MRYITNIMIAVIATGALAVCCSPNRIPEEQVAAARSNCLKQGGSFGRSLNADGSTNSMRCSVVEN